MTCGAEFPFATIKFHSDECLRKSQDSEQVVCEGGPESPCSSTSEGRPRQSSSSTSEGRPRQSSSSTSEGRPRQSSSSTSEGRPLRSSGQPETDNSINLVPSQGNELYSHIIDLDSIEEREPDDWKNEPNPAYAAKKFRDSLLQKYETGKPLHLQMDLRDTPADRERAILSFYKMANIDWACPLSCTLKGDPAIGDGVMRHFFETIMSKIQHGFEINFMPGGTFLFEGEKDHLIPSTSQLLFESDFFLVAGRMMGHSFLHEGPTFAGLSPAIIHVLFGGSPETTTIEIADCADTDVRDLISMLESSKELAAEDKTKITELAVSWDLPALTSQNRMWLHDKLLYHAVIGRTWKQVKQLRRGLKETLIWPLLTE
ncbi:uncharacterized protein LOC143526957 [Brachyhypopomus gauderio]|uniref:uncharacterized protein LOC143526957 n=1 Tax=Brachyhypopomus gauderio TaxID=698409 RepID=UPI0040423856